MRYVNKSRPGTKAKKTINNIGKILIFRQRKKHIKCCQRCQRRQNLIRELLKLYMD